MNLTKQARIKAAGWTIGSTADFLQLTKEEEAELNQRIQTASKAK